MMAIISTGCDDTSNNSRTTKRCEVITYWGSDWADQECYYYTYQDGALRKIEHDTGCNGGENACYKYQYDERGLVSEARFDQGCDDVDPDIVMYEHDEQGRLIRSERIGGGEVCFRYVQERNTITRIQEFGCRDDEQYQESFTYDSNGNQIQYSYWDGVGSNNYYDYYMEYDELNHLIKNTYCYLLEPNEGLFGETRCESTSFEYDDQNRVVVSHRGGFSDGLPRYCATYAYDAAGRLIQEEHDVDCNGQFDPVLDPWYVYDYDASSVLRRRYMNYDWYNDSREFILHKEIKGSCEKPQRIRTELDLALEFPILENEY